MAGADHFVKISQSIPLQMAATISINPTTAYRMLKDFVNLKPGTCNFDRFSSTTNPKPRECLNGKFVKG